MTLLGSELHIIITIQIILIIGTDNNDCGYIKHLWMLLIALNLVTDNTDYSYNTDNNDYGYNTDNVTYVY